MSFGSISKHHHRAPDATGGPHRATWLTGACAVLLGAMGIAASNTAVGAGLDHPILLEVIHLEERLAFHASCEVTDGLGTTRTSSFVGQTNSSVRFVGTSVACRLHSTGAGAGLFQVTLRNGETVLARARGGATDAVMIAAR